MFIDCNEKAHHGFMGFDFKPKDSTYKLPFPRLSVSKPEMEITLKCPTSTEF